MIPILRLRRLDGTEAELAVVGGRFADASGHSTREVIDLRTLVALPGLADAHAHLAATSIDDLVGGPEDADIDLMRRNSRRDLEAGVLLAIDKGFRNDDALKFLDEPAETRPDLEMAGGIIAEPGGYYNGFGMEVTAEDLAAAVARKAASRAQWIKLIGDWPRPGNGAIPSFSESSLAVAVDAAHKAGKRVAVHTMAPEAPGMAVRAGVDSIEHGLFLTEPDLRELGERRGAWVPTIAAVELLIEMLGVDSSGGRLLQAGLGQVRQLLPLATGLGVAVMAGTDLSVPHGEVSVEAASMVGYGMDPADAVHAATASAYQYLGRPAPLEVGADADVMAVSGDPREDITLLQRPPFVMRRGRVVRSRGV